MTDSSDILRRLAAPLAAVVAVLVGASWFVTLSTSDLMMSLLVVSVPARDLVHLGLFFGLMVVMMVAMMLPSALPMIVTYHGITRLEGGVSKKPADLTATTIFTGTYFLIWGTFGILALMALMLLGLMGPLTGPLAAVPGLVLLVAGFYQFTRIKDICLTHCQSPTAFVMMHWRPGRLGAFRMGLRHAAYCVGCCWLFMITLFVTGAMSLAWMAMLSIMIFVEKVVTQGSTISRLIAILLLVLGFLGVAQTLS